MDGSSVKLAALAEIIEITDDEDDDVGEDFLPTPEFKSLSKSGNRFTVAPTSAASAGSRYPLSVGQNAKASWKSLMSRMQQNQANTNISTRGRKRVATVPPLPPAGNHESKRPRLMNEGDDYSGVDTALLNNTASISIDSSVTESKIKSLTQHQTSVTRTYPIASGFEKPKIVSSSCLASTDFNPDNEDYSNIPNWEESIPVIIDLNHDESNRNTKESKRQCPFYKKIPGTRFAVDAFNYGVIPSIDVYFLSHFHSDHYIGLGKSFGKTLICDVATGNLVRLKLGVEERCIRRLLLNHVYDIQGARVTLISANHCPGSVMFVFRLPDSSTVLHTGDFRFTPRMLQNPLLRSLSIDSLYLDTTYCDPKYDFPPQQTTIEQVVAEIKAHVSKSPKTLILCGAYCIGKERVFFSIAEALQTKVFCQADKLRMLNALDVVDYTKYLSSNETSAQVHVVPMRNLHLQFLSEYLTHRSSLYSNLIAVKPSGWEFASKATKTSSNGNAQVFTSRSLDSNRIRLISLPYSEHSSFSELEQFVRALKPKRVQATVGVGSETKRQAMTSHINSWLRG